MTLPNIKLTSNKINDYEINVNFGNFLGVNFLE